MERLDDMVLFAEVAERGSFTAVAEERDISRSLVSKRISALEGRLGVRLLNRTTRTLRLTESGELFYRYCAQVRDSALEAERRVGELSGQPQGRLRVSVPVVFGELKIAPLLAEFLARYPALQVDLSMEERFVHLVEEGFDLAIRIGRMEDSSLVARRLAWTRQVTCASPEYLRRYGRPQRPEELRNHHCITYRHERLRSTEWRFVKEGRERIVPVDGPLRCDNGAASRSVAERGGGITRLPTFITAEALAAGRLEEVLRDYSDERIGVYAVYPSARNVPAKTRVFVEFMEECFRDVGGWEVDHQIRSDGRGKGGNPNPSAG